jgi:MFS family permease
MGSNFFVATLGIGPGNAALQLITPNQMRGQVNALFLFVLNVVGFGIGPTFIALFTDFLFQNEADLRYSMSLCAAILSPIAIAITWYGVKPYGRSAKRAAEQFA